MARGDQEGQEGQQDQQGQQGQDDVRRKLLALLLDKIEQDTYPSTNMLDIVELLLLTPEDVNAYVDVLIAKLEDDNFPSNALIRRAIAFR